VSRRGREHERTEEERAQVAAELERVREAVRDRALHERDSKDVLPEPRPVRAPEEVPQAQTPAPEPLPPRPDTGPVNASFRAEPEPPPAGWRGRLRRLLEGSLGGHFEAQRAWNARQVQLDNALVEYVDARFAATHRHYDGVLGGVGRHLGEVDERHLILQEELVAHVHDLVKRIDLVLAEGERARAGSAHALADVRERLRLLEERLQRG
jgi:hypothetical protein